MLFFDEELRYHDKEETSSCKCCASRKTVFTRDASILIMYMNYTLLIGWKCVHSHVPRVQSWYWYCAFIELSSKSRDFIHETWGHLAVLTVCGGQYSTEARQWKKI